MNNASSNPDRGPGLAATSIVMLILSCLAVSLRIWSRSTSRKQSFWWDDWFAIASLLFVIVLLALVLQWVSKGLGHHASQVALGDLAKGPKYLYGATFIYDFSITLPKYSALFFYSRVFKTNARSFRINSWVVGALITAWILFAIPSTIFQCTPIRKAWLPLTPGYCLDSYKWFLGSAISSVIIDFLIMLLPFPVLWNLHTGRSRKVALTGISFCAYCVLAVSLGRLVAIVQAGRTFEEDLTWNPVTFFYWVICEGSVSVISICLPNTFYLIQRARHHGVKALFSRREFVSTSDGHSKMTFSHVQRSTATRAFKRISNDEYRLRSADDSFDG